MSLPVSPSSPIRLTNLFAMATAGYLQITFLVVGTVSLISNKNVSKKSLIRLITSCLLVAGFITLYKNWSDDGSTVRHLLRVGLRYVIAGLAYLGTAIYILRKDPNPLLGKKLVTIGFFIYGFELAFIGWLTFENYFLTNSGLVHILTPYHGLFELLLYPFIGVSLIIWLLDVERLRNQQSIKKLHSLNQTDGLTNIPNQQALIKHIQNWQMHANDNDRLTLTLLGVDQMQRINNAEGIKRGDELIIMLAKRLEFLCTGMHRFYGRLFGDVFVVVSSGYGNNQITKAEKLRQALSRPIKFKNQTYHAEISAGLTQLKPDMKTEQMLNEASQALQLAKQKGAKQLECYHEGLKLSLNTDLSFENELRTGFKLHQFELYYQPIWNNSNQIICFEALIRWNHPKRGVLTPDNFLSLMQQLGLSIELDYWVLAQAIQQIRKWKFVNSRAGKITVNISAETIQNGRIVNHLKTLLNSERISPDSLTLEITENTAMHNIESGQNTLNEIKKLGVKIAIDDFGTGYSSLNYLRIFPSDVIKFDRSFVVDLNDYSINLEILKSLVPLCHRLNKTVVVEGIETNKQYESLKKLAINGFQGYYLSYPVNLKEAHKLLVMSKRSI